MKIKERIKRWLRKELGITSIDSINLSHTSLLKSLDNRLTIIEHATDIAIDVGIREKSWAVICINGKVEYVHFYTLGRNGRGDDLKYLRDMLKEMRNHNVLIDCHPSIKEALFW